MLIFKRLFFSLNLLITSSGQGVWLCNACLVMFRISNANKCLVVQVHSFEWYQLCFVSTFLVCVMWKTLRLFTSAVFFKLFSSRPILRRQIFSRPLKKDLHLESISDSAIFSPTSRCSLKKKSSPRIDL